MIMALYNMPLLACVRTGTQGYIKESIRIFSFFFFNLSCLLPHLAEAVPSLWHCGALLINTYLLALTAGGERGEGKGWIHSKRGDGGGGAAEKKKI